MNAYGYCVGDPINQNDPTGHFSLKWLNPLRLLKYTNPKAGTIARKKSQIMKGISEKYAVQRTPRRVQEETIKFSGHFSTSKQREYTILTEKYEEINKKPFLKRSIEYKNFTLETSHPITINTKNSTFEIAPGRIHSVARKPIPFNTHDIHVVNYSNLEIQRSGPMRMKRFDTVNEKSSGMLLEDIRRM
ncbi:hypothetical protein D3C84_848630 [compost metagenome]